VCCTTGVPLSQRFVAFSAQHWLILAIFVLGLVLFPMWGRSHRGTPAEVVVRRGLALLMAVVIVVMQVYYAMSPVSGSLTVQLGSSLPLELCDIANLTAVIALATRSQVATAFTYYVALSLSVQAVLTPALGQSFPSLRFLGFWFLHLMVVWLAAYLTWGLGFRPTWRLYGITCGLALVWVAVAGTVNATVGTNFGYLARKPSSASLFDLLGPWPIYVVNTVLIVLVGWAVVMTWPWYLVRRDGTSSGPFETGLRPSSGTR